MASADDIAMVIDNLEPTYADNGWDEDKIAARLDGGAIPERVISTYWMQRATAVITLVNTSESGSSRGNDVLYSRMLGLAQQWDAAAIAIENPDAEVEGRGRISSFPIRRV
jgi:hypothetical protein